MMIWRFRKITKNVNYDYYSYLGIKIHFFKQNKTK
jgi:hypothetical protein